MGKKYSGGDLKPTPVVSIKKEVGTYFKGKLLNAGNERGKFKQMVYEFSFIESTMDLSVQDEATGKYVDVNEIAVGDRVSVFAPTALKGALSKVPVGTIVKITFTGVGENTKGNPPYLYDVEGE